MPARPKHVVKIEPIGNGQYITFFYDGSSTIFNNAGQVVRENPDPNPSIAAAIGAGNVDDAAEAAVMGSNEDARRFNASLQWQQDQVKNTYRVNLMNARTQQDVANANAEYNRARVDLAKQQLAFDRKKHEDEFGLSQAKLGYDVGKTAAEYAQNPESYWLASEYMRNVGAMPQTATFLNALRERTPLAGFGAQAGVTNPASFGALLNQVQGGGNVAVPGSGGAMTQNQQDANNLGAVRGILGAGAHKLGAGALEQLTPTEMALFKGGVGAAGGDDEGFLDQYKRSRIGQGSGGYRVA